MHNTLLARFEAGQLAKQSSMLRAVPTDGWHCGQPVQGTPLLFKQHEGPLQAAGMLHAELFCKATSFAVGTLAILQHTR